MQVHLKVVKGKPTGHCITFTNGEFMFGRGPECDVRPNSDLVSRQHCLLHVSESAAIIRDLGSRNGTLVNGQLMIGERVLEHLDTIQLGPMMLQVLMDVSLQDTALADQDATKRPDEIAFVPLTAHECAGSNP